MPSADPLLPPEARSMAAAIRSCSPDDVAAESVCSSEAAATAGEPSGCSAYGCGALLDPDAPLGPATAASWVGISTPPSKGRKDKKGKKRKKRRGS